VRSATPLVVGLERYRAEQLDHGGLVGGDPAHVQAPLESLSPRPAGLGDQIRRQCGRGKSAQASRSASASSSWRQRQGNLLGWSMSTRGAAHVPLGCRAERRQSDRGFDHLALCLVCSRGLGPSGRSGPAVLHAAPLQPAGDGDLQGRRGRSDVQPPPTTRPPGERQEGGHNRPVLAATGDYRPCSTERGWPGAFPMVGGLWSPFRGEPQQGNGALQGRQAKSRADPLHKPRGPTAAGGGERTRGTRARERAAATGPSLTGTPILMRRSRVHTGSAPTAVPSLGTR
jgi:hypothetical protein